MDSPAERLTTATGVTFPVLLLSTLLAGAVLAPAFDWPTEAFSVIGGGDGVAATVFNAGVVVSGLVALPFAWRLWTGWHPALGVLYGLVGLAFAVAGAFPVGNPLHEVGAVVFVVACLLPIAAGVLDWRAGRRRLAVAQGVLGLLAVAVWLPYDLGIEAAQVGYGGAELVAVLVLAVWSIGTAGRLRDPRGLADVDRSASAA